MTSWADYPSEDEFDYGNDSSDLTLPDVGNINLALSPTFSHDRLPSPTINADVVASPDAGSTSSADPDFSGGIEQVAILGAGAFGQVVKVRRISDGMLFAEKVYHKGSPDYNELNILCSLQHPNLLGCVTRYLDAAGAFHVVLPLAKMSLRQLIEAEGVIELDVAIKYMHGLISAVAFLHENEYYHCDIKPDNILIMEDGTIKLADFGWVYPFTFDTKDTCGTPGYSSPQGWRNKPGCYTTPEYYGEPLSQVKADIYALGATFFHMLFGSPLINYNKYIKQDGRSRNLERALEEAYAKSFDRIQAFKQVNHGNEFERLLDLIESMCALSQDNRVETAAELLDAEPLDDFITDPLIPGNRLSTAYPSVNTVCASTKLNYGGSPDGAFVTDAIDMGLLVYSECRVNSLLGWTIFITLLYRSMIYPTTINQASEAFFASLFVADKMSGIFSTDAELYAQKCDEKVALPLTTEQLVRTANMLVVHHKGILRDTSIYDQTDDALCIIYWVLRCMKSCDAIPQFMQIQREYEAIRVRHGYPVLSKYRILRIRYEDTSDPTGSRRLRVAYKQYSSEKTFIARIDANGSFDVEFL